MARTGRPAALARTGRPVPTDKDPLPTDTDASASCVASTPDAEDKGPEGCVSGSASGATSGTTIGTLAASAKYPLGRPLGRGLGSGGGWSAEATGAPSAEQENAKKQWRPRNYIHNHTHTLPPPTHTSKMYLCETDPARHPLQPLHRHPAHKEMVIQTLCCAHHLVAMQQIDQGASAHVPAPGAGAVPSVPPCLPAPLTPFLRPFPSCPSLSLVLFPRRCGVGSRLPANRSSWHCPRSRPHDDRHCGAAEWDAWGRGHPYQLEGHPYQLEGHPYQFKGHPYQLEGHPYQLEGGPYQLEGHHYQLEGQPYQLEGHPYQLEGHPYQLEGGPYRLEGHP